MFNFSTEHFEFRHFRPHYLDVDTILRQKLCKRAQKILAAAPLRVMASRYNPCE
jgi:hypothetical protein